MGKLECFGCHKSLGNGDKAKFIKFNETTNIFCIKCYQEIREFIKKLNEEKKIWKAGYRKNVSISRRPGL
jgi:hypothetical protein